MNCPQCGRPLQQAVRQFGGKWHGFVRCGHCTPTGPWEPRGEVEIVWKPVGSPGDSALTSVKKPK